MAAASSYVVLFVVGVMALQKVDAASEEVKIMLRESLLPIVTGCAAENQISIDSIKKMREKKIVPKLTNANACFYACIFKKIGMIDEKGLYSEHKSLEKARKQFEAGEDMDKIKEAAKSCNSVNAGSVSDGDKGCDRAKLLFNCIKVQAEKYGF